MSAEENKAIVNLFVKSRRCGWIMAVSFVAMLCLGTASALAQTNVSGYEIYLGFDCILNGQPATCATTFSGWTGGSGAVPDGWQRFPGNGQGAWAASINYQGTPGYGSSVTILSGKWKLAFKNRTLLFGRVTGGSVTWPLTQSSTTEPSCGAGVARVHADLSVAGGSSGTIEGCLHDLPAGTVIPPKAWGTFSFLP